MFKGFFGNLKSCDEHLQFVFITGVTKFSKVSIFSDLNQLNDISLDEDFSSICGITQSEMEAVFMPEIQKMADKFSLSYEECLSELKRMYDGYRFHPNGEGLYNPFSLINAFYKKEFGTYWFSSGTPTFLIKKLKEVNFDPRKFSSDRISEFQDELQDYRSDNPDPIPLFYQSGYLTIKNYDAKYGKYHLGYPNDEVRYSFLKCLVPFFTYSKSNASSLCIDEFCEDIQNGEIDSVMTRFKSLFASLPYSTKTDDTVIEQNFQNVIYIVFILMGQFVNVEQYYSFGRADCVVQADNYIYLFEFKRDRSADEALAQIEEKKYAAPFASDKRKIFKIGVNFDSKEKNINEWKVV